MMILTANIPLRLWPAIFWVLGTMLALSVLPIQSQGQSNLSADRIDRSLNDLQVGYFFEDPARIDWAAVALLSQRYGCHITLARVHSAERFLVTRNENLKADITLVECYLNSESLDSLDIALTNSALPPDVIIFGLGLRDDIWKRIRSHYVARSRNGDSLFKDLVGVRKVYQALPLDDTRTLAHGAIVNQRELLERYAEVIRQVSAGFFPNKVSPLYNSDAAQQFSRYELLRYTIVTSFRESDFLSGLAPLRLEALINAALPESASRKAHSRLAQRFQRDFDAARSAQSPKQRVDFLVSGYRAVSRLLELANTDERLRAQMFYLDYLARLSAEAQRTALAAMGLNWQGEIFVRETPSGPKVKIRARVTVSGPLGVQLARILYYPYGSDSTVVIDSIPHFVRPHQQFVREYLVDDEDLSSAQNAVDSLRFAAEIRYGGISMLAKSVAAVRGSQDLEVVFEPAFRFISKVANVLVDKTVSPFYWKAVVNKPKYYSGNVQIDLKTPPGVAAGAMQRTLKLTSGAETETLQFPLVAGRAMADGISRLILTLRERGQALATDTALLRVANCAINPKRAIGFLPDTSGILEDILRMTTADATALTNRALEVADLNSYQVLMIGSGAFRKFPALRRVSERLARYVRQGGLLVLFGQPEDWPADALSIEIHPSPLRLSGADLQIGERTHKLFSKPYTIYTRRLTETVSPRELSAPAGITKGKKLISDSKGRSLLSIINMGEGRIIYCGFPLLQRIAQLEINAIHLLANIANY
ncbi:hypothetical protein JYT16_01780 [Gemmatimonas aurantiaca]|nr:hypothetical protein [Gemmatimonas aurantiaca]